MKKERESQGHPREGPSPRDVSAPNIWSLTHVSDDSESRTIRNWADLKIDPESNNR